MSRLWTPIGAPGSARAKVSGSGSDLTKHFRLSIGGIDYDSRWFVGRCRSEVMIGNARIGLCQLPSMEFGFRYGRGTAGVSGSPLELRPIDPLPHDSKQWLTEAFWTATFDDTEVTWVTRAGPWQKRHPERTQMLLSRESAPQGGVSVTPGRMRIDFAWTAEASPADIIVAMLFAPQYIPIRLTRPPRDQPPPGPKGNGRVWRALDATMNALDPAINAADWVFNKAIGYPTTEEGRRELSAKLNATVPFDEAVAGG